MLVFARAKDYCSNFDFIDKCMILASILSRLHKKFSFRQRKKLAKAIFKRIWVKNKEIRKIELNPPRACIGVNINLRKLISLHSHRKYYVNIIIIFCLQRALFFYISATHIVLIYSVYNRYYTQ